MAFIITIADKTLIAIKPEKNPLRTKKVEISWLSIPPPYFDNVFLYAYIK